MTPDMFLGFAAGMLVGALVMGFVWAWTEG
jgi:hypothetical protein